MPLPPTPEVVALDRARLATPEHILGALFRAQETAHRRGAPLAGDAAFTLAALYPEAFARMADREAATGRTIKRHCDMRTLAAQARPFQSALDQPKLARLAGERMWTGAMTARPWTLPAGAFGKGGGPS